MPPRELTIIPGNIINGHPTLIAAPKYCIIDNVNDGMWHVEEEEGIRVFRDGHCDGIPEGTEIKPMHIWWGNTVISISKILYLPHLWSEVIANKYKYTKCWYTITPRENRSHSDAIVSLLETWTLKCGLSTEKNTEWTSLQNRGGLVFTKCMSFYNIINSMEQCLIP